MEDDDRSYHLNKRPDKTYIGSRFKDRWGKRFRIASKVIDGDEGLKFAHQKDEIVLRTTPKQRHEIKATFLEDNRSIKTLTFQKFHSVSGPSSREYFSFVGNEIDTLLEFILNIRRMQFTGEGKVNIPDEELRHIILNNLNNAEARRVFADNEELFLDIAQNENLKRDLVALGYRRKQLERFKCLLFDRDFFETEKSREDKTPEAVWQSFFETNKWIFGYGLSYLFLSGLDGRKLEQVTSGYDISGSGKRTDALMKTQALISSLCFVEIKRHDTILLADNQYRPKTWPPSKELSGGVAQLQITVQTALENLGQAIHPSDSSGDPTGEHLFNIEPRSFLVVGSLSQFSTEHGINEPKYRSFELYRRNVKRPKIITFDELFYRAQYIVDHNKS